LAYSLTVEVSKLIADQDFSALAALEAKPNLFRAVGQSNRETWHSAFLGWLLSPGGSHGLGRFPLQLFLTSLADERVIPPTLDEGSQQHFCLTRDEVCRLASTLQLERLQVQPSEGAELGQEKTVKVKSGQGRIDVWCEPVGEVDELKESKEELLFFAVEMKVDASVTRKAEVPQTELYAEHVMACIEPYGEKARGLLVFLGPQASEGAAAEKIAGDPRYFCTNYQVLHDMVLVPCLGHPNLHPEMAILLSHYIRNLRTARKANGKLYRLAYTHREQQLCCQISHKYFKLLGELNEVHGKKTKDRDSDESEALKIVLNKANKDVFGLLIDLIDFLRPPDDEVDVATFPAVETLTKLFVQPRPKNQTFRFLVNGQLPEVKGAGRIALHVVQLWADQRRETNELIDLATLQEAFPASLLNAGNFRKFGYIVSQQAAVTENARGKNNRYYTKEVEFIIGTDGQVFAVSSQWDRYTWPALDEHLKQHHPAIKVKRLKG
jgi:hypothetical protein